MNIQLLFQSLTPKEKKELGITAEKDEIAFRGAEGRPVELVGRKDLYAHCLQVIV
jgi:hypothetical protein